MSHHIAQLINLVFDDEQQWKYQLFRNWPTIFGKLGDKVFLEKIQRDTLVLAVLDACWLQELYALSDVLLAAINEKLDKPRIKRLRFKQGGSRKKQLAVRTKKSAYQPQRVRSLYAKEKVALEHINDPELAEALRDFLMRCHREQGA